jgi:uncharacterized protein YecE (DUF72 family)
MNATACRIGCAGWNLPRYLRDPSLSYLERYAQLFNCVEINSSFGSVGKREPLDILLPDYA